MNMFDFDATVFPRKREKPEGGDTGVGEIERESEDWAWNGKLG